MRFIGNKTQLLANIEEVVTRHAPEAESFCDIFSGTASVARYFKPKYEIYSNDLLYFSYCLQRGTIETPCKPTFSKLYALTGISDPLLYFNSLSETEIEELPHTSRFVQNNYAPTGNRMYFTDINALRIDFARNKVEEWRAEKYINEDEYFYLLACIIEGVPFVSNIAGTYGAFNKSWDKRTSKQFTLLDLPVYNNKKKNLSFNLDGSELLKHISGDVLYIDPPYNERQYLPNYHVLETIAKYDSPKLRGITGQRPYEQQKSDFCSKKTVVTAFDTLLSNARFTHIILSYNTDGIMSLDEIEATMKNHGIARTFEVNYIPYRRFKSRSVATRADELKEMLIYIKTENKNEEVH